MIPSDSKPKNYDTHTLQTKLNDLTPKVTPLKRREKLPITGKQSLAKVDRVHVLL